MKKALIITGIMFFLFQIGFSQQKQLKIYDFSGNSRNYLLKDISSLEFENISDFKSLILFKNKIPVQQIFDLSKTKNISFTDNEQNFKFDYNGNEILIPVLDIDSMIIVNYVLLLDTLINPSTNDVIISIPGKITVEIPKECFLEERNLTIRQMSYTESMCDSMVNPTDIYDVTVKDLSSFEVPIKITMYYDVTKFPENGFHKEIQTAFYHDSLKKWLEYQELFIDSTKNTVSFTTDHLTPLSWYHLRNFGYWYSHYRESEHFRIFWSNKDPHQPPDNNAYGFSAPWQNSSDDDPYFIQDLNHYLEEAYSKYQMLGLSVPTLRKVNVYVKNMTDNGLLTYFFSSIVINNKPELFHNNKFLLPDINGDGKLTVAQCLPSTAAHELMHYVQDYYYVQTGAHLTSNKWWMEALAATSDRIVWNNRDYPFEIDCWTSQNLIKLIHRSWDDCNYDPGWYVAGGFLSYLMFFKEGEKITIKELMEGMNNSLGTIIYSLDVILKSKFGKDIGHFWNLYIQWTYSGSGPVFLAANKNGIEFSDAARKLEFKEINNTLYINGKAPKLSAGLIQILNHTKDGNKLVIKNKVESTNLIIIAYKVFINNPNQKLEINALGKSEYIYDFLPESEGQYRWELLFINSGTDLYDQNDIEISIIKEDVPDLIKLLNSTDDVEYEFKAVMKTVYKNPDLEGNDLITMKNKNGDKKYTYNFSGTSFSFSRCDTLQGTDGYWIQTRSFSGNVSGDGKMIQNVKYTYNQKYILNQGNKLFATDDQSFDFNDIPITTPKPAPGQTEFQFYLDGNNLKGKGTVNYYTWIEMNGQTLSGNEIIWDSSIQTPYLSIIFKKSN